MESKNLTVRDSLEVACLHRQEGRQEQAENIYRQILAQEPRNADALHLMGVVLHQAGKNEEAVEWINRAIRENSNEPVFHANLGCALEELGQLEGAVESYERVIGFEPNDAGIHNNLGNALSRLGRFGEAEPAFRRAMEISPDFAGTHKDLGILLLLNGRMTEGWAHYEWRRKMENLALVGDIDPHLYWDGSSLAGKTIFVYSEQGFGDAIQFVRYCRLLAESGARVMVACEPAMRRLFEGVSGIDQLVDINEKNPDFDFHVSLVSLPGIINTALETIPSHVPYIRTPEGQQAPDEALLETGKLKVGLVWKGNPLHVNDKNRSISLEKFEPILMNANVRFFSLQTGESSTDISKFGYEGVLNDLSESLTDFAVTASVMDHLDLLISVDTSVVHLAGAMGKPVWTLLPLLSGLALAAGSG